METNNNQNNNPFSSIHSAQQQPQQPNSNLVPETPKVETEKKEEPTKFNEINTNINPGKSLFKKPEEPKVEENGVKSELPAENKVDNTVNSVIIQNAQKSNDVKNVIDLAATSKALENDKTVEKIIDEKTKELISDAEKKKIESETLKIQKEAEKVKQEQNKEIAELEKVKNKLYGEVANLQAEDDKATAFFESNKSILKCIGVREKLSLKAMQWLMFPAGIIFALFQIVLLPFSLVGFAIECLINIVSAVCGKVAKGGVKIVLSILVTIVILALIFGVYYVCINWIFN